MRRFAFWPVLFSALLGSSGVFAQAYSGDPLEFWVSTVYNSSHLRLTTELRFPQEAQYYYKEFFELTLHEEGNGAGIGFRVQYHTKSSKGYRHQRIFGEYRYSWGSLLVLRMRLAFWFTEREAPERVARFLFGLRHRLSSGLLTKLEYEIFFDLLSDELNRMFAKREDRITIKGVFDMGFGIDFLLGMGLLRTEVPERNFLFLTTALRIE